MMLASSQDVVDRLGRPLTTDEASRAEGLLAEASALVEGWLGSVADPVPDAVSIVVSRMVARALTASTPVPGLSDQNMSAGPFEVRNRFTPEASSGGVWLTRQDKIMLRPFGNRSRVMNFPTA
ncbi:head-to-tail adaptor [Mycobacterium phage LilSpotty]|uniref:Head-to-tail adaptor n=1 Tax=Mycobacterium phage LilSpotty TaxID=2588512 RepID=A0A4Y6EM11_9CAUD|nr:head-to-tail adaptor [Mycobacterium phage LilSpotty]QDF19740.1 head-to-tail adaptor [Mycobacterium phage LilSpotty]